MRPAVDEATIRAVVRELARAAREPLRLYLTGGATAVLEGWRPSTLDIDLRLEPEDELVLRRLSEVKDAVDVNIELVSPPDFVPELPGWRGRSPFVFREGRIDVHHFDPYSQALSKVERGFEQDRADVAHMIETGLVEPGRLLELFTAVEGELFRYPALDPATLRAKVEDTIRPDR